MEKAPSGAFSIVSTMDRGVRNMRAMLERRLRALCFLEIHAISHMEPGNPYYFVHSCKGNARIDEIVWMVRFLFFGRIKRKLLTWYFAIVTADEGRMPGANLCYLVKRCISAAQTARNRIEGRSRSHNRFRLTSESATRGDRRVLLHWAAFRMRPCLPDYQRK